MAKKSRSRAKRKGANKRVRRVRTVAKRRVSRGIKAPKRRALKAVKKQVKRVKVRAVKAQKQAARREVRVEKPVIAREKIAGEANLLVTFDPNKTVSAKQEVENLLKEINENFDIEETNVNGVFKIKVNNSRGAVRKLIELCRNNPDKFSRTFRWIPIDKWCKSDINEMRNVIKNVCNEISNEDKWKMDLEKRQHEAHERDLIIKLTEIVDKPNVDLKNPDKIIKVDIIGNEAGISILRRDEVLNVVDFKK